MRLKTHPTDAVLRRLLDEPAAVVDPDRHHVAGCPQCLDALAALQGEGDRSEAAPVASGAGRHDADVRHAHAAGPARSPRPRGLLRRPAVAAVAVAAVLAGASTAAANEWLPIFRTERVAPIGFTTADLVGLPDLDAYGEVEVSGDPDVRTVPDTARAAAETGLDVPEVTALPRGVDGEPVHQVAGQVTATFTFSAERAADAGGAVPAPPPGLDGSQVRLVAGPGTAAIWTGEAGTPSLIVGRAVAPTASSSGVPFETIRDYLLSLPGVPDDVAAQLRTFAADGSTLPLPVPSDRFDTSSADVNGVPATVLVTRDRTLAAVVWVDGGLVTVVAGPLDADEVLAVARELA